MSRPIEVVTFTVVPASIVDGPTNWKFSMLMVAASLLIDQEGPGPEHVIYVQAATHGGAGSWRNEILSRLQELLGGA